MGTGGSDHKREETSTPLPAMLVDSIDETALSQESDSHDNASRVTHDLSKTSVARILWKLYADAFTGALLLTRDETKKVVYFQSGYPISAKSNVATECLGRLLLLDGQITKDQLRESLVVMEQTKDRQGSILLDLGALTREGLVGGLALQTRFRISETFSWDRGSAQSWSGARPAAEATPIEIAPATFIFEAVRAFMAHPRVIEELRPHIKSYLHPTTRPDRRFQILKTSTAASDFLARIDGTATTKDLLRSSTLPVIESSALLFTVLCTEMALPKNRPLSGHTVGNLKPQQSNDREPPTTRHATPRVHLARLVKRLRAASPAEILGVPGDAPPRTIEIAYQKCALERHPDTLGVSRGEGLRALAEQALEMTANAYQQLTQKDASTEKQRPAPASAQTTTSPDLPLREDATAPEIDDMVQRIIVAELHHQRGLELLDKGQLDAAMRALARAVSACDEEGEFRASLAWALFQSGLDDLSAHGALEHLDRAIVNSRSARPHLYRGHILLFLERPDEAVFAFQAALHREPECEEARSELERIQETLHKGTS